MDCFAILSGVDFVEMGDRLVFGVELNSTVTLEERVEGVWIDENLTVFNITILIEGDGPVEAVVCSVDLVIVGHGSGSSRVVCSPALLSGVKNWGALVSQ